MDDLGIQNGTTILGFQMVTLISLIRSFSSFENTGITDFYTRNIGVHVSHHDANEAVRILVFVLNDMSSVCLRSSCICVSSIHALPMRCLSSDIF